MSGMVGLNVGRRMAMIVGQIEKLEKLLSEFCDLNSSVTSKDVMKCVADSAAAEDSWYIPVVFLEDGMNETDIVEGHSLEEMPLFRKIVITNPAEESYFCAFTSEEAMNADHKDGTRISVKYKARALLRDLLAADDIKGLVINPWTDAFMVSKENAAKALEYAEKMPESAVAALRSYRLDPKAVIDTNEILEGWREGWHDEDGKNEPWELVTYPIMPNGHVLLLFMMKGEICGGRAPELTEIHSVTFYRVLELGVENGKAEILNKYRFKVQDAHVGTVFLHDGVLSAAISDDGSEKYDVVQMVPGDDDKQFTIYRNIETAVMDSSGNIVVAYCKNLLDPARYPVMVINSDGDVVEQYHDEKALACLDVNLDSTERVWFHMYPSETLDMLNQDTMRVEMHRVALQGFRAFALSTDGSKLYTAFTEYKGGSAHFVMMADQNGDYVNPIRFAFLPEDKDGNILETKDCKVFGKPSTMKSWVLLNADGVLYLYDIDDC